MLVATVLGPEQREDRELEVVRLPAEQVADPLKLAVRQPKGAMKRLFRYRRQRIESSRLTGQVAREFRSDVGACSDSDGAFPSSGFTRPQRQSRYGFQVGVVSDAS
jgi:hypothetical protein